jgi:acetylornithine deacetylase/succinyl-diaminopimelate desuccinylase-like protein
MDVVELLSELVAIDSVNPALVPGGAGESEIAEFVASWAASQGLAVQRFDGPRPSVVVRAPGRGGGKSLLLCGHLDTVGVEGMTDPFVPRVAGDRLHGRGAYDMKAGLAACLHVCRGALQLGLRGDVIVAAVADEEHASLGVQEVLGAVQADAAIVTEPTHREIVIAHKGFVWAELAVRGRAAHGSRPEEGVDAIVAAAPVLARLRELDEALGSAPHPLLGRGSVHASLIAGGEELSTYPARCVVSLERRTLPGETAKVDAELEALLEGVDAEARTLLVREPFSIAPDAAIVNLVREASGGAPLVGAAYWTDAAFIAAAGIPTVLYGPGGAGAHAVEEWVSVSETNDVARVLVDVAAKLCA